MKKSHFLLIFNLNITLIILILSVMFTFNSKLSFATSVNEAIPREYFGTHLHSPNTAWPSVDIGSIRLWDSRLAWFYLQPSVGKWDFKNLDYYVETAQKNNAEIVMTLGLTPHWASSRPQEQSAYGLGYAAEPNDMRAWRHYVMTLGNRYKGKVKYYEIWNEPYSKGFYSGSVSTMVELTKIAYEVLKSIDPEVKIISPTADPQPPYNMKWFDEFLHLGGGDYIDVVSAHFYITGNKPEQIISLINNTKKIMHKYNISDKPIWNTEAGRLFKQTDGRKPPAGHENWVVVDERTAESYLLKSHLLAWANDVKRFHWYSWDHGDMGFVSHLTKNVNTYAINAYDKVIKLLQGSIVNSCVKKELWECSLKSLNNRNSIIVWAEYGQKSIFKIPPNLGFSKIEFLDGTNRTINIDNEYSIHVGEFPVQIR